ncbi:hypothetical protein [Arsenicibacter rosenii]|uniref:Uncharacterized protein n=1 Tax=Arsenicibacter rosenii TaxID=1750698 RepID=A0A1S2VGB3_9BACT|nr:hypothetical protein [Arsenicibacter rosenii]OIN57762.1 hypothetical protein BLX24_18660 [Arsenicibacter rosenii]
MDRTDKSNQKAGKEFGTGSQTGGAKLIEEKTEDVKVSPSRVNDTSDGMKEKDFLGKSNQKDEE